MPADPPPDPALLRRLLGGWGIRFAPPETRGERRVGAARLADLSFRSSRGDAVPAWFARPEGAGPFPAVLYCHAHGARYEIGRWELVEGRPALANWLADLTGLGLAVLCLEMPCFGARADPGESALAKALAWEGRTLFGLMLAELSAGLDWLATHPAVDPARLGAMGFSMGATHAFWLGALEPRLRAVAHMCPFADLRCLIAAGAHDGHGSYMTVPGLLPVASTGTICGLIAPRAQLACAGLADAFTPAPCVAVARAEAEAAYAAAGAAAMLEFHLDPARGHEETQAMRVRVKDFLSRRLVG